MESVSTVEAVRNRVQQWRAAGERVVFVPTMGNLHRGHLSLLQTAQQQGERVVVSIFVNPMQFGPNEDFAHYPRTPQQDATLLQGEGCSLLFIPEVGEIYPHGPDRSTQINVPELTDILCGAVRPGHFTGVATVVAKLLHIVMPDAAVFGEKDYQQLTIIRRMVTDLCINIKIIGAATVREVDGLAMSSRNQYLTPRERQTAPLLYQTLLDAQQRLRKPAASFAAVEEEALANLIVHGFQPDYFSIREAVRLSVPVPADRELVVLAAARLGRARLIDNLRLQR
jgi:pantoate--beta-alanine ligase